MDVDHDNVLIGLDANKNVIQESTLPLDPVTKRTQIFVTSSGDQGTGSAAIRFAYLEIGPQPTPADYLPLDGIFFQPWHTIPFESCSSDSGSFNGSFSGLLTGSFTGSGQGRGTGSFSGTFSGSGVQLFRGEIPTGSTSQSFIGEEEFLYELFLEDVVKLADNRLALYVSRRNIDTGSSNFGEYRVNKFESILFPQKITGDQYSASVDFVSGLSVSLIQYSNIFDIELLSSMSVTFPSGSSSLRDLVVTHSVHDIDSFVSGTLIITTGTLNAIVLTHSVHDVDAFQSGTFELTSVSIDEILSHSVHDIDAFQSGTFVLTSGALHP